MVGHDVLELNMQEVDMPELVGSSPSRDYGASQVSRSKKSRCFVGDK